MERILEQLRAHTNAVDDDDLLQNTISILLDIQRHPDGPYPISWDALHRNFQFLRDRGQWEDSAKNDELLDALHTLLTSPSKKPAQDADENIFVDLAPVQDMSSRLVSSQDYLALPTELIDILNDAYFIHILATDPAQALPPGKSLLSVMSRLHTHEEQETKPTLRSKVEDLAHKAFWDEAVDTLSNPEPSTQLPRIKLLYNDLYVALSPLLPPKHPVLVMLSSPFSPTLSPLDSSLMHLRGVLAALRERCAPVRDSDIEAFQRLLDNRPASSPRPTASANLVVETIRNILRLSDVMKDDLSQFVLGSMTEQQLQSVVSKQAKEKEREVVIDIWYRDRIKQGWSSWLERLQPSAAHLNSISAEPPFLWITRIVQALGSHSPVTCPLPPRTVQVHQGRSSSDNDAVESSTFNVDTLPPVFFLSVPTLLKMQNYLQALVITASLRVLARIPADRPPSDTSSGVINSNSFVSRVWTLLHAEITGEPGANDTKIINLADEVVRARIQVTSDPLSKEDEAALRAIIDRTLRAENPVYKLLQCRLLTELSNVLIKRRQRDAFQNAGPEAGPTVLRTGRDVERVNKRPRLVLDLEDADKPHALSRSLTWMDIDIKGFEDPVLKRAVGDVFRQVDHCLGWVENVWSDVIETGNVKDEGDSSSRKRAA